LIDRLDPNIRKLAASVRTALRKRFPTANELVYDYPSSLVIAYSATDRGIDGILSIAARKNAVELYFNNGPGLPDPKKLLQGSGKQTRLIPITAVKQLAHPDVKALIAAAIGLASVPLSAKGEGNLVIKTKAPRRAGSS
jgi:hypothetical protein